jgi:hypothetical protein
MAPPTREQIAARADYLFRVLNAQASADGIAIKDGRSDDQRRILIAEILTEMIYEHDGMLDDSSIMVIPDAMAPGMGIVRIGMTAPGPSPDILVRSISATGSL